jgi:neutral ceramidase
MKTLLRAAISYFLIGGLVLSASAADAKSKAKSFRAGAAASNITPNLGGPIVGGFNPFPSDHVHDELHARCLVLDNGDTRLAFAVVDLVGAEKLLYDEARRLVTAETGLPGECLIMSATHTHSATSALGKNRFAPQNELDDYQKFVARRIADGVRRAMNNLAPAKIGWATGSEAREVFNRRWYMKPGTVPVNPFGETTDLVKMNPPRASPNLDKPAGPTDPEICLIAVQSLEGKPIGVLANYSLHYVGGVRGADISADYYALFADRLQQLLGADRQDPAFVAIMSNGTSGNINNIDFSKTAERRAPYEKMREVADRVATAAHKAYQTIQWRDTVPLGAKLEMLDIGVRHPTRAQLERAKAITSGPKDAKKTASLEYIYAERTLRMEDWPARMEIPIQALRVGDVAIGGIPNEVFVEIGLEYKRRSPFKPSFIMSIANGYYGYLPTPEHHKLGGYETWLGTNRLEVEASNMILAKLLGMVDRLR